MPFDPQRLTPTGSLNRVPFIAARSISMPAEYEGKSAFSLIGTRALDALVLDHREELQLTTDEIASGSLSYALRSRLTYGDPAVSATASHVVSEYGRRLGYLVAILTRGDAESRAARPEWDESYWVHWGSIERLFLGGGLAWPEMCDAARSLVRASSPGIEVILPPHPTYRPVIGAARSLHVGDGTALVIDFGQTETKRVVVVYRGGTLQRLEALPVMPASPLQGMAYIDWIAGAITSSTPAESSVASICVSSYLDQNQHPAVYANGRFNDIQGKIANLRDWLSAEVSGRVGRACEVSILHDTTAAGVSLSPASHTAIIMLGTALGSGFPYETDERLTPLAPDFTVLAPDKR